MAEESEEVEAVEAAAAAAAAVAEAEAEAAPEGVVGAQVTTGAKPEELEVRAEVLAQATAGDGSLGRGAGGCVCGVLGGGLGGRLGGGLGGGMEELRAAHAEELARLRAAHAFELEAVQREAQASKE